MSRSWCSLPTGMRSQWASPMIITASAASAHSSPTRIPVRASISTISRGSGSCSAAARMNRAAEASSKNLGNGSSTLGRSDTNTGQRAGLSSQPHSMIRSKNTRSIPRRIRTVLFFNDRPSGSRGVVSMVL